MQLILEEWRFIINTFKMQDWTAPIEFVQQCIQNGYTRAKCHNIHGGSCNAFCFNYIFRVWKASYKTYGAVYLVQLLFKLKKISKNPIRQILKFIFDYLKSTSLTAVQMMIMRRVLCFLAEHYKNKQNNLIIANFLSGLYIVVESYSRQTQISLYQINNTGLVLYNMAKRRNIVKGIYMGECWLVGLSTMVVAYHFFNNRTLIRQNYVYSILTKLLGDV